MKGKREVILSEHDVAYIELGDPLWFVLALSDDGKRMDIVIVSGKDEEEARSKIASNNIIRCVQLYQLLDRAKIMTSFINAINEM